MLKGESPQNTKPALMISFGAVNLWTVEKQDLGEHYRWANNDTIRRLVGGAPQPRSFAELETWYQSVLNDPKQEIFSIKTPEAQLIGWAQLCDINFINGQADIGLVVDEAFWGRGVGHDALVALVKYCFEDLRLHRAGAHILSINLPSLQLFKKVGFQKEGVKREAYFTSGRFLDVECLGLLCRDFKCPQAKTELKEFEE